MTRRDTRTGNLSIVTPHTLHDSGGEGAPAVSGDCDERNGTGVQHDDAQASEIRRSNERKWTAETMAGSLTVKRRIQRAMDAADLSRTDAAERLKISRARLAYLLSEEDMGAQLPPGHIEALLRAFPAFRREYLALLNADLLTNEARTHAEVQAVADELARLQARLERLTKGGGK